MNVSVEKVGEIHGKVEGSAHVKGSIGGMKVLYTDSYAIALANGFEGTVKEWLESLKGGKGDPGENGQDGFSPLVTVTSISGGHRVSITDKEGTNTFDVMDGVDGKTPVVGTDYFTASDKAEMVAAVVAALPVYDGSVTSV